MDTHFEYDDQARLTAVVENHLPGISADQETNVRTEYAYNANGSRMTITDANQHTTTFVYDALERLVSESDPLDHTTSYGYNAANQKVSQTDANGFTTYMHYDSLERLAQIDYPSPNSDVTFHYNVAGQRTSMQDGLGSTAWSYDNLGRTTAVTDPFSGMVQYAYDGLGQRTSLIYPDAKTVSYAL